MYTSKIISTKFTTNVFIFNIVDIDECETDNGGCSHNCTNTIGSFFCWCPHGQRLALDGLNCEGEPKSE